MWLGTKHVLSSRACKWGERVETAQHSTGDQKVHDLLSTPQIWRRNTPVLRRRGCSGSGEIGNKMTRFLREDSFGLLKFIFFLRLPFHPLLETRGYHLCFLWAILWRCLYPDGMMDTNWTRQVGRTGLWPIQGNIRACVSTDWGDPYRKSKQALSEQKPKSYFYSNPLLCSLLVEFCLQGDSEFVL
jgi:hypothetical protein